MPKAEEERWEGEAVQYLSGDLGPGNQARVRIGDKVFTLLRGTVSGVVLILYYTHVLNR